MPPEDPPDLIALLDRYERPLIRYACSIVGDLDSARDVVQETFIKFAQGSMRQTPNDKAGMTNGGEPPNSDLPTPVSESRPPNPEAWLFTVTRNRALDHLRKHSRIIPMELPDDRQSEAPGPAAAIEQRESATSIFDLLDALSPNQREVIRLKFQNDLTYREIAEITQLSVTNVGFLLHAGLKKLRALLRERSLPDFDLPLRSAL
jgi:RNA polymerase sigma-70 factor (ECF subfamily)